MALQKRWVIGNVLGWAIGFPTGLIGSVRLDDFYEGFVNPSEESLLFAVMFTVVVATCQWLSLNSNLRLKWTLGSFLGAFLGHFIIDTYSFYVSDIYFVRPIFFEFIGCTGLDIPPRWFPGLTGCYGVFPPVSAVILGLFIAIGQLWAAKLTYRWAIINAVVFCYIHRCSLSFTTQVV